MPIDTGRNYRLGNSMDSSEIRTVDRITVWRESSGIKRFIIILILISETFNKIYTFTVCMD